MDRGKEVILKATMILFFLSSFLVGFIVYEVYVSINGSYFEKRKVGEIAKEYINVNYPDLELAIDEIDYNYRRGTYSVSVYSKVSRDTYFDIFLDSEKKVENDNYELVKNGTTTFWRLSYEYGDYVREAFEKRFSKDFAFCSAELRSDYLGQDFNHAIVKKGLVRDKDYDIMLMGKRAGMIDICFNSHSISNKQLADLFLECKEFLEKEKIPFHMMGIILQDVKADWGPNTRMHSATLKYNEIDENVLQRIYEYSNAQK